MDIPCHGDSHWLIGRHGPSRIVYRQFFNPTGTIFSIEIILRSVYTLFRKG